MRLVDGAEAIRGDLPSARTRVVDVPLESGDAQGTQVARFGSLSIVADRVREALAENAPGDWTLTIGGDCGVEIAPIGHVLDKTPDVAVVWFDAHPDLNTTETSPSHAFTGMVLRALTGDTEPGLAPATVLDPSRIVLAGTRSVDLGEELYIAAESVAVVSAADLESPEALVAAIEATGATSVYVHIDLDVLDPGEILGLDSPVPFGVSAASLVAAIKAIKARFDVVGAGIAAFAPASPEEAADDLPTILRIIGALTA